MKREDFEERGLWRWLAQALAKVDFSLPIEERLKKIGVRFKVHKTPYGDLILFDKPNVGGGDEAPVGPSSDQPD